ncbi:YaaC family protein [Streptomyces sp. BE133]|uniref:YaaC family protein n=1 Tax=Streptomyces sp. BE133 TaxID=3002523 RepID=UPI002E78B097|nr:YaaC family protein [Streptomyces sp. BE133]MEE1806766.1 YaaC family protein [Streptomyces sp. BE133]
MDDGSRTALEKFLGHYPGTAGYVDFVRRGMGSDEGPNYRRYVPDHGLLIMHWQMPEETGTIDQRLERLQTMTREYACQRYFFPTIAGLPRELHPLMAWWVVLYALSMLARYQPAEWARLIDVDNSQHAIPIERILEQAMEHLPTLIAATIEEVAT